MALIKKVADTTPMFDEITEEQKGVWKDISDDALHEMFKGFITPDEDAKDEIPPEFHFHKIYDEGFFRTKYDGLPECAYAILEQEATRLNK